MFFLLSEIRESIGGVACFEFLLRREAGLLSLHDEKAFGLEGEALLLEFQRGLPVYFAGGFLAEGFDVDEGAARGAFGLGFAAVEEAEAMEVGLGPIGLMGFGGGESGFGFDESALAAPEEPAGDGGVGGDAGGVEGAGHYAFYARKLAAGAASVRIGQQAPVRVSISPLQ